MKILVELSAWYPHYTSSSLGIILDQISPHLKKKGIEIDICTPIGGNIKIINPSLMKYIRKFPSIDHYIRRIYFWKKALNYTKQNYDNYDLFWVHNPNPLIWKNADKKIFDKVVLTQHSSFVGVSKKSPYKGLKLKIYFYFMKRFEKQFFNNIKNLSNKIIVISPFIAKEIENLGIKNERIVYISNGVDAKKFKPLSDIEKSKLKDKYRIPKDKLVIISVGQLIESKHPIKMIKAYEKIKSKHKNLFLIVVGRGKQLPTVKKMVDLRDDKKLVEYMPHPELLNLYKCSDYYITASTYEGQSLALLEAMASGLICITSKIPNLESIIKDANCGISIDFDNIEESINKLSELFDKSDSKLLGENARRYVERNHDWSIISDQYLKIFYDFKKLM